MAPNPPDERRELAETAAVFEMIAEANPADRSALEALSEIYAKLGDKEKLARVTARLGAAQARPVRAPTPPASAPKIHPAREPASPPGAPRPFPAREVAPPGAPRPFPAREAVPPPKSYPARDTRPSQRAAPKSRAQEAGESQGARLQPLGDLLVSSGLITRAQLEQALRMQRTSKEKLGSILVRLRLTPEAQLAGFLSAQYGMPSIALGTFIIDPDLADPVPADVAKRFDVVPIRHEGDTLTLAMADPVNVQAIDQVGFITGLRILPVVAAQGAIRAAIERSYEAQASGPVADLLRSALAGDLKDVEVVEDEEAGGKVDVFELKGSADEAPVVKLVNMMLVDAIQKGASDIHWEPYEKVFRIRFRVDGVLHEMLAPPKRLEPAIISRLKIMANLDIAERRLPQDGRIKLRYNTREIDFRGSVLPTIFGEKAVLRILVGETRDLETAQSSIRAALTGHLVFSTLHTNDCPSTVARLVDMGIPPFLVASALLMVLAQRLGRRICKDCKEPYEAEEETLVPYGHEPTGVGRAMFHRGKGCATCNFTGMKGRVAIYEIMPVTQELRIPCPGGT